MSAKLNQVIEKKRKSGQKLLSVFITAGFPNKDDTVDIISSLDTAGVDFIELGVPFSDPIADGPVIQEASNKALENEMGLDDVFKIVKQVRKKSEIPIILMGYLNPIYNFGIERAIKESHTVGIDGWIVPDWPLEESSPFLPVLNQNDIDLIHLIAPNTPIERIRIIDQLSSSFIYCVSYTGVTGADNKPTQKTTSFFREIRNFLQHPLMIGFGIKNHQDYKIYSELSDGVIIGSAFIKMIQQTPTKDLSSSIKQFVKYIRTG